MLQTLVDDERKNGLLLAYACGSACSDPYSGGISPTAHQSQCDDIRYLLTWAAGEIWVVQRTSGHDTNQCLSRVVRVLLHMLVGAAIPLMQLMQKEHPVPLRATRYDRRMLILSVLDTFTYATCRDFPPGCIDFKALSTITKAAVPFTARPSGSRGTHSRDVNDQNGRVGNSCAKCHEEFPAAFLAHTGRVKRRRSRPNKKKWNLDPSTGAPAGAPTDEPKNGPHDSAVAAA